jgi:hypothetical protein
LRIYDQASFSSIATQTDLAWMADSRGIALSHGNIGPMSAKALDWLGFRGIRVDGNIRFPIELQPEDMARADLEQIPI